MKTECLKCGCPYEQKGDFYFVSEETLKYLEKASQGNYNITAKVGDVVIECLECGSPLWWSTQPWRMRMKISQEQFNSPVYDGTNEDECEEHANRD